MKYVVIFIAFFISASGEVEAQLIRLPKDTIGFAFKAFQMDSVVARIYREGNEHSSVKLSNHTEKTDPRVIICPHDDYTYAGRHYEKVLRNLSAETIIIFGVNHKVKTLSNKMIFDQYDAWQGPYGEVKISPLRDQIIKKLPSHSYLVRNDVQQGEHSVEAMLPFLQYHNRKVKIISIIVPYMPIDTMKTMSDRLAKAIKEVMADNGLNWGKDISFLISSDAVHYGDEDWSGRNYAPFGCDSEGYKKALNYEKEIVEQTLFGKPNNSKVEKFVEMMFLSAQYNNVEWTWCGDYPITFGLLTAISLVNQTKAAPLEATEWDYSNSIDHEPLPVKDLGIGITAPANAHHWVGYVSVVYR